MLRLLGNLGLFVMGIAFLTGCGNSLSDQAKIFLDQETGKARLEVEMSDGLEVDLNGEFPLANGYGSLFFEPATRTSNAKIVVELDVVQMALDQANLDQFGLISELPNGTSLPVSMTPPLIGIPVTKSGKIQVTAALALVPELQLAAIVAIQDLNTNKFPVGVRICQNFRNDSGYAFASACVYGPANGQPGGIFIGGNFGEVLNLDQILPSSTPVARSSTMALSAALDYSSYAQPSVEIMSSVSEGSYAWTEERYDPRKKLSGSSGYKAMKNLKKVLSN